MKNLIKKSLLYLTAIVTFCFYSCQKNDEVLTVEDLPQAVEEVSEKLLAQIDYGESGKIDFIQLSDGELLVNALVKKEINLPTDEDLDPVEFYEKVMNKTAPSALIKATKLVKERAELYYSNISSSEEVEIQEPTVFNSLQQKQTGLTENAEWFRDNYCRNANGDDFTFCWVNGTGTSYVKRGNSIFLTGYASPYRGIIRHQLKVDSKVKVDHLVREGWVSRVTSSYGNPPLLIFGPPTRESLVFEADNDIYNHSVFGWLY